MSARRGYILYVCGSDGTKIFRDGKSQFKTNFRARYRFDKNDYAIRDRRHEQFGVDVYMIDINNNLYSICWPDIDKACLWSLD